MEVDWRCLFDFWNVPHIKQSVGGKGGKNTGNDNHIEDKEVEKEATR